jgi:hypothetical protein
MDSLQGHGHPMPTTSPPVPTPKHEPDDELREWRGSLRGE